MKDPYERRTTHDRNVLFRSVASGKRRVVLGRVLERDPTPVPVDDLVEVVATHQADGECETRDRERARTALHHDVLPALSVAGVIEVDREDGTVVKSHVPIDDELEALLIDHERVGDDSIGAVFDALANARRRLVCSVLGEAPRTTTVDDLARRVAAREADASLRSVSDGPVERVLASLYHVHVPHLADAGLVEYDAPAGTVSYVGHPDLRFEWLDPGEGGVTSAEPVGSGGDCPHPFEHRT